MTLTVQVHCYTLPMKAIVFAGLALLLAACAATEPAKTAGAPSSVRAPSAKRGAQVTAAVESPLSDLDVVHTEIPSALLAAKAAPYTVPEPLSCDVISTEAQLLDAALGPDLDTPETVDNRSLIERGSDAAGAALREAAEGIVPFRSWVRKLTGAERRSREVAASIVAGTARRSYLKGLGQSIGCKPPAAPRK
jgi:hypothetical protein